VTEFAEHYAGMERGSSREEFNKDLALEGAVLHEKHCSTCHFPPDHEGVADAVGIPLHGQRSESRPISPGTANRCSRPWRTQLGNWCPAIWVCWLTTIRATARWIER